MKSHMNRLRRGAGIACLSWLAFAISGCSSGSFANGQQIAEKGAAKKAALTVSVQRPSNETTTRSSGNEVAIISTRTVSSATSVPPVIAPAIQSVNVEQDQLVSVKSNLPGLLGPIETSGPVADLALQT